jgi:hypothetical protein
MKKKAVKSIHPLDMMDLKNVFIEVYWLNQWHRVRYDSWEPVCENDFRQPMKGGVYTVYYHVTPFHMTTGRPCQQWNMVHESRVRKCKK